MTYSSFQVSFYIIHYILHFFLVWLDEHCKYGCWRVQAQGSLQVLVCSRKKTNQCVKSCKCRWEFPSFSAKKSDVALAVETVHVSQSFWCLLSMWIFINENSLLWNHRRMNHEAYMTYSSYVTHIYTGFLLCTVDILHCLSFINGLKVIANWNSRMRLWLIMCHFGIGMCYLWSFYLTYETEHWTQPRLQKFKNMTYLQGNSRR